ncbi:DUF188 domain-containing protein [Salisediminibacterium selenitireducens]|uniref:UPF0178 protein Bsel_2348 n=1 Tax=Bacillus selenitireducens (strain ATCC 700615 / DSM 15326 / MLS10) TaxID=439292 RepID=D6XW97_BACIE|nr:DUF188 domain-containing protein [Salisediminibacterium selenitireducens]ADH99851.1 protein of unknown function DUF188 [[Bacillus] selenitireducens MLS10]
MIRLFIDGDACPVVPEVIELADRFSLSVILVSSYAHTRGKSLPAFVEQIIVDPDREAADLRIANLVSSSDVIITDDLGLSSLLLAKGATVLQSRGNEVTHTTIDFHLDRRYHEAKVRKSGKRHKGPKPFTADDRAHFSEILEIILRKKQEK